MSIQPARFLGRHDRDTGADGIGELGGREINSGFSRSYSSGPLVSGQSKISRDSERRRRRAAEVVVTGSYVMVPSRTANL
jgi:hypothetical protein